LVNSGSSPSQAAARSALLAIRRCQPFKLPPANMTFGRRRKSCLTPASSGSQFPRLFSVLVAWAGDLLEPGQYGLDIELFALFRGSRRLEFRRRASGCNLGRKQGRPGFRLDWLFLGGALDLEIEIDLGAKAERHRIHGCKVGGVPMGTFADRLNGRLGGADEAHDRAVFQLGVVAHQPQDGVRAILPARNRRVPWSLFSLRLGQMNLRFREPEPMVRVSLAFGKLVTG